MEQHNSKQPMYIMPEGSQRSYGKEAQRNNILAAKLVAETVRTTLGPRGMDKMIVDDTGDVTVTNDGVTILEEMRIEHPAAKMIVAIAQTQEEEVGDGTTSAVVLAGELLKEAEQLMDQNIHPTVIIKGYNLAAKQALQTLKEIAHPLTINDTRALQHICMTAMTGKSAEVAKEHLAKILVEAVTFVAESTDVDLDLIKIEKKFGPNVDASTLIKGILLDKERVHKDMPSKVQDAKILLLDLPIEVRDTSTEAKIQISDPSQLQSFLDMEETMIKKIVEQIKATGANVVMCQKGVDEIAQHFLAKAGIYVCRRVRRSDLEKLAKATGAKIVTTLEDFEAKELGQAGSVYEHKVGDEYMTFVEHCPNPKAVTILARASTEHSLDEIERAMHDALGDLRAALELQHIVAGAGAPELAAARALKETAHSLSGREQLAVQAFARALEIIPKTLAENAGLDPIDVITELHAAHEQKNIFGIDVISGKAIDAFSEGIIEPLKVKTQAISSATEVAVMILRIDDVILGNAPMHRRQE